MRLLSLVLPLLMSCSSLMGATVFRYLDCWTLYGDYLYLQPSVGSPYFAETAAAVSQAQIIANRPDFNSAWRVGLNYDMEEFCGVLGANYMQFSSSNTKSVVAGPGEVLRNLDLGNTLIDADGGSTVSNMDFLLKQGEVFLNISHAVMETFL
jgi:hypothetical protein